VRHHVLVRLLGFLKPYRLQFALATLAVLASGFFVLAQPKLIGWAVNLGLGDNDRRKLFIAAGALLGAAIMRGVFGYVQQFMAEWLAQHVAFDIRNQAYDNLQKLSYAYHDKAQIGQIMARVTGDVESVRFYISMGLIRLSYTFVLMFVALGLMLAEDWRLALVSWTFLPLIAARSVWMNMKLRPVWDRIQEEQGAMSTVLQENLSGMRVVKSFAREEFESKKFLTSVRRLFTDSYAANRIQAVNSPLLNGLGALSLVVCVWYGGHQVNAGRLSVGDLTAFMLYLTLLQMPMRSIGFMLNSFARAHSSGTRIYEILDAESAVKEKPDAVELAGIEGHVRFEDVSFGYTSVSAVLRDIEIDAQPGEMIALLGPTGSGKSTVVNLLPRFYDVTGGRITVDGIDIRDATLASLRRQIGIVQQDVFLFIDTIRENIRYGRIGATDEDVEEAAKVARIHDFILTLPEGYDTWVGERGVTLSGGQKQRIAIARTLLLDPRILVFDDSTSSVDMATEYQIQQALADLMRGRTTFVIAQRLRTVRRADQILVLNRGQIAERGKHEELLALNGLYRSIYDLELRDQEEAFARAATAQGDGEPPAERPRRPAVPAGRGPGHRPDGPRRPPVGAGREGDGD
jgi:ABC-type multidrug transport system fused ATPase/permease subunit